MIIKLLTGTYHKYYILVLFLLVGTALYSPFINNHFTYDDFLFVSLMEENIPYNPYLGFWAADISDSKLFESIWWFDNDAEGNFFRPIPTLVISTAYKLWGRDSALILHLFSIILHSINAFLVYIVMSRIFKKNAVSLGAGFIYLICVHHAINVGWIATNTDILAVFFMMLSIYCYINFRERNKSKYLIYSSIFQVLSFGCKETASITSAAIIVYEFIFTSDKTIKIFLSNWKKWTPSFILTICFLIFYKLSGFGINSLLYYDPFIKPLLFGKNLFLGYPIMFLGLLSIAPVSFPVFITELLFPFMIIGVILTLIFIISLIPYRKDKTIVYCFLLFIISILPQLSADASERQLYFPYTVGSFLISFLIFQLPFLKKKYSQETPEPVKYIGKTFSYYLLISSVIITFLLMFYYPLAYSKSAVKPEYYTLKVIELAEKKNAQKIILLNIPGSMNLIYMNDIYRFYSHKYTNFNILYGGDGRIWLKKNNDSTISLKTDNKGWITNFFARVFRTKPILEKGSEYKKADFTAKISEITNDGKDVLEVDFKFNNSLTTSDFIIIYFDGNDFKKLDFNKIRSGEWIFIGDTSDLLKYLM